MLVLCLILASGTWIFTSLNETFTCNYDYRIGYPKMPEDKVPAKGLPYTLTAELEATGWDLFQYNRNRNSKTINIDLSTIENNLVSESNLKAVLYNQLPNQIEIHKIEPREISVEFEQKYSKKVPVVLVHQFTFKDGYYQKGDLIIQPDSITITGAKSVVDSIQYYQTADTLQLKNLTKTVNKTVEIIVPNSIILNEDDYLIDVEVVVAQHTEKKLDIPVALTNANDTNFLIIPSSIELKCLVPVDEYDNILPEDFSLEADYKNNAYNGKIDVTMLRQHEFAKQVSFYPNEVDYIFIEDE